MRALEDWETGGTGGMGDWRTGGLQVWGTRGLGGRVWSRAVLDARLTSVMRGLVHLTLLADRSSQRLAYGEMGGQ